MTDLQAGDTVSVREFFVVECSVDNANWWQLFNAEFDMIDQAIAARDKGLLAFQFVRIMKTTEHRVVVG